MYPARHLALSMHSMVPTRMVKFIKLHPKYHNARLTSWIKAPQHMFTIIIQLNGIGIVLHQLRSHIFRSAIFQSYSAALIEETTTAVADCCRQLRQLARQVIRFCEIAGSGDKIGVLGRAMWKMKGEKAINTLLGKLMMSQSKLEMMLGIFIG
jgi:hypothetical protein